ncbi:MAG: nucleotide-binding universal stress UspA family protein, partial [Cellvibrionaceae bacterium]
GQAYTSICNLSEKNTIDLIVLGSHGEYRVRALLDPTANGVLNHEKCDVHLIKMK